MKPYMNFQGKGRWSNFWDDKVKHKFKRIFSKSARQNEKKIIKASMMVSILLFVCSCRTTEPTNSMFMPRYVEIVDTAQVDTNYFYRSHQ